MSASNTGSLTLTPKERWEILHRDGFACRYCGAKAPEARLHVDHVLARALGGTNDPENLVTACQPCNQGKAASELVLLPWQRQMAVFGLMVDWLIAPLLEGDRSDLAKRLSIVSDFALAPVDPAYLWEAIKDVEGFEEAVEIMNRVEFGDRFDA